MELGTAYRASVGLRVKAAIHGIMVLGLTLGAHLKRRHGGQRSIIGAILNDGEAGAAVGTVGEGVAVSTVLRVVNFANTGGAGGGVGGDLRARVAGGVGGDDAERGLVRVGCTGL